MTNKTVEELHDIVIKCAHESYNDIIKKLEEFDSKERWLLHGRIINCMFSHHYGASLTMGENAVRECGVENE